MTTYYIRADGAAVNKAAATVGDTAAHAMSVAVHNGETFAAGDTIYISDKGGTYSNTISSVANYLIVPSSGGDITGWPNNTPITYAAVPGETPVFDASFSITNSGWSVYNGTIYRKSGIAAHALWEDGVALIAKTVGNEGTLAAGQFCYSSGYLYYCPTNNTPADHTLKGLWVTGSPIRFATDGVNYTNYLFDIRDRNNIDVSGLTFNYGGIGHGQKVDPGTTTLVKNIRIHHNTFNYVYWAIWGDLTNNCIEQDVNIYNNTMNYCNCGISTWTDIDETAGRTHHPLRHTIYNNTINHLSMINSTTNWGDALQDDSTGLSDHEGISFQDPKDCVIRDNTIQCDVTKAFSNSYWWTRAVYFFITPNATKTSGNQVLRNRCIGRYYPAIYVSANDVYGFDAAGGYENNTYAMNVLENSSSTTDFQGIWIRGSNSGAANLSTTPNYIYNNTINYPNGGGIGITIGGNAIGYFTVKNNIVVSPNKMFISPTATTPHFTIDYNVYSIGSGDFSFNGGGMSFPAGGGGWQTYFDANGAQIDPVLNSSDSALQAGSPPACRSSNDPIEGVTVISGVGQIGIDGMLFDVTQPSLGASQYGGPPPAGPVYRGVNGVTEAKVGGVSAHKVCGVIQ